MKIDSKLMEISLPQGKVQEIIDICSNLISAKKATAKIDEGERETFLNSNRSVTGSPKLSFPAETTNTKFEESGLPENNGLSITFDYSGTYMVGGKPKIMQ